MQIGGLESGQISSVDGAVLTKLGKLEIQMPQGTADAYVAPEGSNPVWQVPEQLRHDEAPKPKSFYTQANRNSPRYWQLWQLDCRIHSTVAGVSITLCKEPSYAASALLRFVLLVFLSLVGVSYACCVRMSNKPVDAEGHQWWQHAVFYEIYPRSFADSNNDGVGDLKGITSKLDYLKDLGVDAIWISPCFPSPQVDFGYDVSDYENIDPMYGTLADFDMLASEAKKRGIHIILDFVVNHTSDQHQWFLDSKSSRTSEHRDWYIWRDGKGRRTASEQLDLDIRRLGVEVRSHDQSVLLPLLLCGAARPELAQSGGEGRDV